MKCESFLFYSEMACVADFTNGYDEGMYQLVVVGLRFLMTL